MPGEYPDHWKGGEGLFNENPSYPDGWDKDEDFGTANGKSLFGSGKADTFDPQRPWYDKGATTGEYRSDMMGRSRALGNQADAIMNSRHVASRAYKQGLHRAADATMGRAAGGGAGAGRAASYATDQMHAVGNARAAQMDLQEDMQRQQMMLAARQQQVGHEQMMRDDASRRFIGGMGHQNQVEDMRLDEKLADNAFYTQLGGTIASGGAGLIGGLATSDETQKNVLSNNVPLIGASAGSGYEPPSAGAYEPTTDRLFLDDPSTAETNPYTETSPDRMGDSDWAAAGRSLQQMGEAMKSPAGAKYTPEHGYAVKDSGVSGLSRQLEEESEDTNRRLAAPSPVTPESGRPIGATPGHTGDIVRYIPELGVFAPAPVHLTGSPPQQDPRVAYLSRKLDSAGDQTDAAMRGGIR